MSCTLSHECRVMLSSLLTASTDATRVWLRAEMDRTVDPMLHSIFNRLTTKLTNQMQRTQSAGDGDCAQVGNRNQSDHDQSAQIHQLYTLSHFNPQFVNMNNSYNQPNFLNHLDSISKQQQSSQSKRVPIKEEIDTITEEPNPTHQVQSSSYEPVSNEQSNHNLTDQHSNNNEECENSQINLSDTEKQPQPQQLAHIKHNQFDDEECDCDECVDGGIEVKEEDDDDDDDDQVDGESSRPVKKPRIESILPNNAQPEVTRQSPRQRSDLAQSNEDRQSDEGDRIQSEQSEAIDTRATIEHFDHGQHNSDESMVIQQEERDANNVIGEEIATDCTTNPIQANRHLQCSHCLKSCVSISKLQTHLRVHTGERPFQCDLCYKRFTERGNLEKHLRTHSKERPHQCRFCENSFTELNTRNKHEQATYLHVKPYRCKQCGHTATLQTNIITHIRVVHFGLPPTIKEQRALNIIDERDPRELLEKV